MHTIDKILCSNCIINIDNIAVYNASVSKTLQLIWIVYSKMLLNQRWPIICLMLTLYDDHVYFSTRKIFFFKQNEIPLKYISPYKANNWLEKSQLWLKMQQSVARFFCVLLITLFCVCVYFPSCFMKLLNRGFVCILFFLDAGYGACLAFVRFGN